MKKMVPAAVLLLISLALVSCGGDHHNPPPPPTTTTQILSDPAFDGDILQTSPTTFTVTQGMTPTVQSVFAGIDPGGTGNEYRAFLDFPLGGAGGVPLDAVIVSATLDIVINNVFLQSPSDTIAIRIELVSIPTLTLVAPDDFSRTLLPAIKFTTIQPPISSADVGNHVAVDVTSLMVQAQILALPDFQVRIMEDLGVVSPGVIEINDTTGSARDALAPLLQVVYQ